MSRSSAPKNFPHFASRGGAYSASTEKVPNGGTMRTQSDIISQNQYVFVRVNTLVTMILFIKLDILVMGCFDLKNVLL